jgi:hypothetical protein
VQSAWKINSINDNNHKVCLSFHRNLNYEFKNNGNQIILRTKTEKEEIKNEIKSDVLNLASEI